MGSRKTSTGAEARAQMFDERVYLACKKILMQMCLRLVGDRAVAEDIIQETFVRALENDLDLQQPPLAWLRLVAKRLCIDHLRRGQIRPGAPALPQDDGIEQLIERLHEESVRRAVLAQLETLRPREQRVLWLRDAEGLEYTTIADLEGTSPHAARTVAYRARRRLRARLAKVLEPIAAIFFIVRYRVSTSSTNASTASSIGTATLATIAATVLITTTLAITGSSPVVDETERRAPVAAHTAALSGPSHRRPVGDAPQQKTEESESSDDGPLIDHGIAGTNANAKSHRRDRGVIPGENHIEVEVRDSDGNLLYRSTTNYNCRQEGPTPIPDNPYFTSTCGS